MTENVYFWHTYWEDRIQLHTTYFLEWAETYVEEYDALATEHDNLISGLSNAYEGERWEELVDFASFLCRPDRGYLGLRGYWSEMELHLRRAIQAAQRIEFWNDAAALQQNLAVLYMKHGQAERAKNLCYDALSIFQKQKDRIRIAETRGLLATIARLQGDTPQAKVELLAILEIFQQRDDSKNIAITLNQLGQLAESEKEWDQALAYHDAELEMDNRSGNLHGAALAQWSIGNIQYHLGDLERANHCYQEAYDRLYEIGDQQNLIRLLAQRANLTNKLGKTGDAISIFEELVKGAQQLGDQLTAYDAMFNLARLYRQEGNVAKGVEILRYAIRIGEAAQLGSLENDKQALRVMELELVANKESHGD